MDSMKNTGGMSVKVCKAMIKYRYMVIYVPNIIIKKQNMGTGREMQLNILNT